MTTGLEFQPKPGNTTKALSMRCPQFGDAVLQMGVGGETNRKPSKQEVSFTPAVPQYFGYSRDFRGESASLRLAP
jgi:hypothetical protein